MSKSHVLTSSPDTVHWGFFDSALAPVLTIRSGDEVRIETVNGQPRDLVGLPFEMVPEDQAIHRDCTPKLGPHIVTGPIAVHGAQPGDMLLVQEVDIELRQVWAWKGSRPVRSILAEELPRTQLE